MSTAFRLLQQTCRGDIGRRCPDISRPMNPHQDTREIKRYFRRCAAGVGPSRLPKNTTHRTKHVRSASRLPKRHYCGDRVSARAARDRGAQKATTWPAHAPMQPWVTQPMAAKTAETKRTGLVGPESPVSLGVFSRAGFAIQPRPRLRTLLDGAGPQAHGVALLCKSAAQKLCSFNPRLLWTLTRL